MTTIEIEPGRDHDDITIRLYGAAVKGCVRTLNSLLAEDNLILNKISLTPFAETPLHISSLLGHLEFTKEILKHKPALASELDHLKRSPLHLAASEGHVEIVRALLPINKEVCFVKDKDGRIPLHYASMNGRVLLIELLLISAGAESVCQKLPSGETALHLCVQHNHLEALKLLVESAAVLGSHQNTEVLNAKVFESGNTILHLAVMLRQVETVDYLLSIHGVEKDSLNKKGHKASDLLGDQPKDFSTFRIQRLMSLKSDNKLLSSKKYCCQWISKHVRKHRAEWLKNIEGSIMVVATVIVSMTFQAAVNPPGGVWQQTYNTSLIGADKNKIICDGDNMCVAGTSVLAHVDDDLYTLFVWFNSIAFLASVTIILLIIGGVPIKNKFWIWFFDAVLFGTLLCVGVSFLCAMISVTPNYNDHFDDLDAICTYSIIAWIGIFALMGAWHFVYLVIRLRKRLRKIVLHYLK